MKIAIAGFGTEGRSNYRYFKDKGDITIVDERESLSDLPAGVQTILGEGAFSKLQDFNLVLRAPGLNPNKIKTDGKIWSATNEFFELCPAPIIGVTGTKGKGTTSSLIASILRAAGKKVHLVGNIGIPALDELPNIHEGDIVVYELSSFQLWDAQKSPQTAVVLEIEPDHLDVHDSFEDYVDAKSHIVRFQTEDNVVVYLNSVEGIPKSIAMQSKGKKIPYMYMTGSYARDGFFWYQDEKVCSTDVLILPGGHNFDNACAAIAAAWQYTQDKDAFATGIASFNGLPHRLKFVSEVNDVKFYDDSIATTPGSAIAALHSFEDPKVIILGGSAKGVDYEDLIDACRETGAQVIAIGETGVEIARLCRSAGVEVTQTGFASMDEIVDKALDLAQPGSIVILSPASASFDMFKSYADRGEQFIAAVRRREVKS